MSDTKRYEPKFSTTDRSTATRLMTTIRTLTDLGGKPHANVFPEAEPKTIRLALSEGENVPPHTHPGRDIIFYLIEGTVELQLDDETHEVTAGEIARFRGEQEISPHAVEESTALIVLASRSATDPDGRDTVP